MMANVSSSGELHDELWKLSDIDEVFAQVPLPYDVLIDLPELDDVLLATHFAVESANWCYAGPRLEDSAPAGNPKCSFGRPATESQITAGQKDSVPINTKKEYKLSSECVEGLVQVPEANVLSFRRGSYTYSYLPSKRS